MSGAPYYTVRPTLHGTWAVVHIIPGLDIPASDLECATRAAAEQEAMWMNRDHEEQQRKLADERRLCGVRA